MTEPEPLLTVRQVAAWLGLTDKAVRNRVERRTIPVRRVGSSVRFDRAEIDAWTKAASAVDQQVEAIVMRPTRRRRKSTSVSLDDVMKELGYR